MSDDSVEIVHRFWDEVWNAHAPEAVERFVTEDFVITSGGVDTVGRAEFKKWIAALLDRVEGLRVQVTESFQNADGSRVASRWVLTGRNNGFAGTEAAGQPIEMSGTAVWAVTPDGRLAHNWVERAALEQVNRLRNGSPTSL
jgi:steroid delta-isomerase-like uncharacterized protein